MKEDVKDEQLTNLLDRYEVTVPREKLLAKQTVYQRFIRYLASPAKDPLERWTEQASGFVLVKVIPIACGLLLAVLQGFLLR